MLFQFQTQVSEQDYIDYNKFHMFRSPYGKKIMRAMRIFCAVLPGSVALFYLIDALRGNGGWFGVILFLAMLAAFEVLLVPMMSASIKANINKLKKTGKMAYSPSAELTFYDEYFVEITEINETKVQYSAIERISIVDEKMIYIHFNNISAYQLPISAMASSAEYESFLAFIKTKNDKVDVY